MMAVLQTIDLKKYYGEGENQVKALDGINYRNEAFPFAENNFRYAQDVRGCL